MPEDQINTTEATATPSTESNIVETKVHEPAAVETKAEATPEAKETVKPTKSKKEDSPKNLKEHWESIAKKKAKEADDIKAAQSGSEPAVKDESTPDPKTQSTEKWTPNFKFKVKDKEYEIPAWARGAITTKEAEKEFVDLFTKAEGLEPIKGSRDEAIQRAQAAETEIGGIKQYVSGILKLRDEGNLDKFFKHLKVSDQQVVEHALKIVERNNLPPEQKELYNNYQATQDQLDERETQFQRMQQMWQQTASLAKKADLQSALAKAEHTQYAENYDTINGTPGAFRQAVIDHGEFVHTTTGKDLSAEEAINAVKARLGKGYIPQEKPVLTQEQQIPVVKKDLPVIPNIAGKNVSHVQKSIRNTKDLKSLYREKFG